MTSLRGGYNPVTQSASGSYSTGWKDIAVWGAVLIAIIFLIWYLITKTGKDILSGLGGDTGKAAADAAAAAAKAIADAAGAAANAANAATAGAAKTLVFDPAMAAAMYAKATVQTVTAPVSPSEDNSYDPAFDPHNVLTMGNRTYSQYILNKHMGGLPITETERKWCRDNDPTLAGIIGAY